MALSSTENSPSSNQEGSPQRRRLLHRGRTLINTSEDMVKSTSPSATGSSSANDQNHNIIITPNSNENDQNPPNGGDSITLDDNSSGKGDQEPVDTDQTQINALANKENEAEQDDEPEAEEEYSVEAIVKHRNTRSGRVEYLVKWENYSEEENSWVDQDDINAAVLLKTYWESAKKPGSEAGSSQRPVRKRQSSQTTESASKKTRTTPNKGPVHSSVHPDLADEVFSGDGHHYPKGFPSKQPKSKSNSKAKSKNTSEKQHSHVDTWDREIEKVESIEQTVGNDFVVHLIWKNGAHSTHSRQEANMRCPQKMIKFYEQHLRFRTIE